MKLPYEFIETEEYEKGFAEFYKERIVPLAPEHEKYRKKQWFTESFLMVFSIIAGVAISFYVGKSSWFLELAKEDGRAFYALIFPPFFAWFFLVIKPRRKYFNTLKQQVAPVILEFYGNFTYNDKGYLSETDVPKHCIFDDAVLGTFPCEDIITFQVDGICVQIMEKTSWEPLQYHGHVYMIFTYPFKFEGEALIIGKKSKRRFNSGKKAELEHRNKTLKKRKKGTIYFSRERLLKKNFTQNEFNEHFDYYSNDYGLDQLFCEYFMAELINLGKAYEGDGLLLSVTENQILLEIESHQNLFEIGSSYDFPVFNHYEIKQFIKDLHVSRLIAEKINNFVQINYVNVT